MDARPLGAAGRAQRWSCETGRGGRIRSSSPSSGVNRRSGTFTQPLTSRATSQVTIKVRGRPGPQRSARSGPSCLFLLVLLISLFFFVPPRSPFSFLFIFLYLFSYRSGALPPQPGPIETSVPPGVQNRKQEKINEEDEWRPGGPIKHRALLTQTHFITSENGLAALNLKGRFRSFKVRVPWKGYDQLSSYLL